MAKRNQIEEELCLKILSLVQLESKIIWWCKKCTIMKEGKPLYFKISVWCNFWESKASVSFRAACKPWSFKRGFWRLAPFWAFDLLLSPAKNPTKLIYMGSEDVLCPSERDIGLPKSLVSKYFEAVLISHQFVPFLTKWHTMSRLAK